MTRACFGSIGLAALALLAPGVAFAQANAVTAKAIKKTWTPPRTPDGHPDFQGIWNSTTLTPLERPREFANKEFLTPEEALAFERRTVGQRDADPNHGGAGAVADPSVWWEQATKVVSTRRTSFIVDPPDGKMPAMTAAGRKAQDDARAETRKHPIDRAQDRSLQERCLLSGTAGPPMLPGPYNNNYQFVVTPDAVAILVEMSHDARLIAMDGRPHAPQNVRQWMGDSIGHWEGDTLVVDTTNFNSQTHFRGSDENLHLIERFTMTDSETLLYEFIVDDPTAFVRQWKAELPMKKTAGPLYEFACHEGNVAMEHMLNIARQEEKAASSK